MTLATYLAVMAEMSEARAQLFHELYLIHRDALTGELSDTGTLSPASWEEISKRNRAALVLTFQTMALAAPARRGGG